MDDTLREEIRRRLDAGERPCDICRAMDIPRWYLKDLRFRVKSAISVELAVGDRVQLKNGTRAIVVEVTPRGAILYQGGHRWRASHSTFFYDPPEAEKQERMRKIREACIAPVRGEPVE